MSTHDATIWLDVRQARKFLSSGNSLVIVAEHRTCPRTPVPEGCRRIAVCLEVPTEYFARTVYVSAKFPPEAPPTATGKATA